MTINDEDGLPHWAKIDGVPIRVSREMGMTCVSKILELANLLNTDPAIHELHLGHGWCKSLREMRAEIKRESIDNILKDEK